VSAWPFDQGRDVACVASRSVVDGRPVLCVTHYADDHDWGFTDGGPADPASAVVVAMATVVDRHPDLTEVADLPPGWSATRADAGLAWARAPDPNA